MNASPRIRTAIILPLLVAWAVTGCEVFNPAPPDNNPPGGQNNSPPGPSLPTVNIDGNWRHEATGSINATCLTIQNVRVTAMDENCDGTPLTLLAAPQAQANASGIQLFVGFGAPGNTVNGGVYTYMLQLMPDGTLQGTVILRFEPSGPIHSGPVTLVKQ